MTKTIEQRAAATVLRRRMARSSLIDFADAVPVPGKPVSADPDEWIFQPVESRVAAHHRLIMQTLQHLAEGTGPRQCMLFFPPGSAKSTYASVVFPTWEMGRTPETRVILASYASDIARKQSRRARQIVRTLEYQSIFRTTVSKDTAAADEWSLLNGSEFMANGINAGMTGNRAHWLIVDDPVAGREEADSEATRRKTRQAYEDDLTTRLIPGGRTLLIQTRWHEDDLAGGLLPADWAGESGDIACRDGLTWRVVCVPAVAEREDDPLGRAPGERLWPEWFGVEHFDRFRQNPRTWSALYQQRPAPETGDYFQADWLVEYDTPPPLAQMSVFGASDYAVTSKGGDFTVHMVLGIDLEGRPWLLDVWRRQAASDLWIEAWCDLVERWKPLEWAEENGQIAAGIGPLLQRRAIERRAYCYRRQFPTRGDKSVRAQSIRGRIAMRGLYIPRNAPWVADFRRELMTFPAGRNDDMVDALGLLGQLLDHMTAARILEEKAAKPPTEPAYTARADGRIVCNMTVRDIIAAKEKKRKRL